jgi:hypothetical protein
MLINSGTIDPFCVKWAIKPTRYIKRSYKQPTIAEADLAQRFPTRYAQAKRTKILVAGMTRTIEAWLDARGEAVAAKSTVQIFVRAGVDPYLVLGVLNSRLFSVLALTRFAGKRQQGGYLALAPDEILSLPRPSVSAHFGRIAELSKTMQHTLEAAPASPLMRTEFLRSVESVQAALDRLVEDAYGLSPSERAYVISAEALC